MSGLIRKGKFGGIDWFDSMLEEQVGYMDATALRGIPPHCRPQTRGLSEQLRLSESSGSV